MAQAWAALDLPPFWIDQFADCSAFGHARDNERIGADHDRRVHVAEANARPVCGAAKPCRGSGTRRRQWRRAG